MDRRRSSSKARRQSADEQLEEMLQEHRAKSAPPRRSQSLEPSTSMTPALKRTAATPKQTPVPQRPQETVQVPMFTDVPPLPRDLIYFLFLLERMEMVEALDRERQPYFIRPVRPLVDWGFLQLHSPEMSWGVAAKHKCRCFPNEEI